MDTIVVPLEKEFGCSHLGKYCVKMQSEVHMLRKVREC